MNRLAREKSPYLLQHASNPVDWYPWGEEAFAKARAEDKPVFLSIGYSTCHWCHVMERESFEDPAVAALLNASYVPVKVDREERPDVDRLYMTAANAAGWGGGWPLNLFLTPDLQPFYGGTYFPPRSQWGRPGFGDVLRGVAAHWGSDRAAMAADAGRLVDALNAHAAAGPEAAAPDASWPRALTDELGRAFDERLAGFGRAPKFPMPPTLEFLLDQRARTGDERALSMALRTLRAMGRGGIFDQVGGGFHRYSTDAAWRVPHFEKMLYDNAQLASALTTAYQATHDPALARRARETLDYMLRELERPGGGFYAAEDADSVPAGSTGTAKSEGAYYLWTSTEVESALGAEAPLFEFRYGVEPGGNAPEDPHGEFAGRNILYEARTLAQTAKRFKMSQGEARRRLETARRALLALREKRPRPARDEKVIVSWNGLALSALARGWQVLGDRRYLRAAQRTAAFLRKDLYDARAKRLERRWAGGEAALDGLAEDYAFLAQGLIDLYEADFDPAHLAWALELQKEMETRFSDGNGAYSQAPRDGGKDLFARLGDESDGAEPSAASVAALNLLRLSQMTEDPSLRAAAERVIRRHGALLRDHPRAMPLMMSALGRDLEKPRQVVVAGALDDPGTEEILRIVRARLRPPMEVLVVPPGPARAALVKLNHLLAGMAPLGGKATAYVCVNFACELPTSDLAAVRRQLDGDAGLPR
ncbi:MAG: thioredoxin domain-containing protein [Elusimicrobia bacterium]|nr:thioredoxin domain-containing protein [Elusimicrobiota bacterium]